MAANGPNTQGLLSISSDERMTGQSEIAGETAAGTDEMDRLCDRLNVREPCARVARSTFERGRAEGGFAGYTLEQMAAGALYLACKRTDTPRTLANIASASNHDRTEVSRGTRELKRRLDIEPSPIAPTAYIERFCAELDCGKALASKSRTVVSRCAERGLFTGNPAAFAAAAIYTAANQFEQTADVTQVSLADVSGYSRWTIRQHYQEQVDAL